MDVSSIQSFSTGIVENIFRFEFNQASIALVQVNESLVELASHLDAVHLERLNGILSLMMDVIPLKDYLLMADVLTFELDPFLTDLETAEV